MRVSRRQKLLRFLRARWKLHVILSDDSDADEVMEMGAALKASRYLIARPVHNGMKLSLKLSELLAQDAVTFRLKTRLCQQTFLVLLGLLHSDPIFHNMSHNPQRPVGLQLYCYLVTVGHDGNGQCARIISGDIKVGEGTVSLYVHRVMKAMLNVKNQFIKWPSPEKRKQDSAQTMQDSGFYCFGIVDGTHVYFSQAPAVDANNFFTRKKGLYGMNVQLVVDFNWYIIGYIVGWPGCAQDVTSFESSQWFLNPSLFFGPGESLMADKGYVPRLMLTVPFDDPELVEYDMSDSARQKRVAFNDGIKKKRILIERVNARLKNRLTCLKALRLQVRVASGVRDSGQDFKAVNDFTVSCFVLHNFLVKYNDAFEKEEEVPPVEDEWANDFQSILGRQACALARASSIAEFSMREQEIAARELAVQMFTQHDSCQPAAMPFQFE
jgi:DDE superfamily endonuclease